MIKSPGVYKLETSRFEQELDKKLLGKGKKGK